MADIDGNVVITTDERKYKTMVTDLGNQKLAGYTLDGPKINITTAVVGDGGGSYYIPTPDMTEIKNEVWRGEIAEKKVNAVSPNMVDVKIVLDGTVGGFTVREVGLLDNAGNLIVVSNFPDTAKALILDGIASKLTLWLHVLFTNVDAVQFVVDASVDNVTREELEAELKQVIREHNRADHPETELVTLDHQLGTYPQVLAFAYQYGAGMGEAGSGPAGGTSLMQLPAKAECLDKNRLAVYTTKDAARSETVKEVRQLSRTEYVVLYQGNEIDAVYLRLLCGDGGSVPDTPADVVAVKNMVFSADPPGDTSVIWGAL